MWPWDFEYDGTEDGRQLKFLNIVDKYTRECFMNRSYRCIGAREVVGELRSLMVKHGKPEHVCCDNGPEFIASAIREWSADQDIGTIYIGPGRTPALRASTVSSGTNASGGRCLRAFYRRG